MGKKSREKMTCLTAEDRATVAIQRQKEKEEKQRVVAALALTKLIAKTRYIQGQTTLDIFR